jgi:hypothetical protein
MSFVFYFFCLIEPNIRNTPTRKRTVKRQSTKAIKDHHNQTDDKQENNIPVSLFQSAKEENRSQDRASTNN